MPEQLRKGLERCHACGVTVRPKGRKVPCPETPQCRARVIHAGYALRGWAETFNVTQGKILEEAGVPVEWAPAGVHVEQRDKGERGRHGEVLYEDEWTNHDVAFAPNAALRAVGIMKLVQVAPALRRRAIKAFYEHPEFIDALDSLKRLRGKLTQSHISQAVHSIEAGAKELLSALVLEHGQHDDRRTEGNAGAAPAAGEGDLR